MVRRIIEIDRDKCNGCGACAEACHEGAIGMMNGNMTVLAVVSYFTPVLSCIFCWMFLGAELSANFWKGVGFVVAGSLICWASTVFAKPKA